MAEEPYEIVGQIDRGHFGAVYEARHRALGWSVALKVIPVRTSVELVLEEAKKLAALPRHDNVVQVLDAGPWGDCAVYIASELCHEGSLADRAGTPLDPATACGLVSDACRGLDHLHQHDLLHLDIRPANILISEGKPRLADFGLARWSDDADVEDWYGPPRCARAGGVGPMGHLLGLAVDEEHESTGLMISSIVLYLNENDPGPGFFTKGVELGLLARNATRDQRQVFWVEQVHAVQEHYRARRRNRPHVDDPSRNRSVSGGSNGPRCVK